MPILVKSIKTEFGAEARLLCASKRNGRIHRKMLVHPRCAGINSHGDIGGTHQAAAPYTTR